MYCEVSDVTVHALAACRVWVHAYETACVFRSFQRSGETSMLGYILIKPCQELKKNIDLAFTY